MISSMGLGGKEERTQGEEDRELAFAKCLPSAMSVRTTRAKKASLLSSQPVPSIPTELRRSILSFCDPSTLAKVSRASVAFAELATPFLYRNVVLKGPEALESFFCKRLSEPKQLASLQGGSADLLSLFYDPERTQEPRLPPSSRQNRVPHLLFQRSHQTEGLPPQGSLPDRKQASPSRPPHPPPRHPSKMASTRSSHGLQILVQLPLPPRSSRHPSPRQPNPELQSSPHALS